MPHVSKRKISRIVENEIRERLLVSILKLKSKREVKFFLKSLLTETEEIMLGKRLTIIYLLWKGASWNFIESAIGVTPRTIDRLSRRIDSGAYKPLVDHFKRNEPTFTNFIEKLLNNGKISARKRWEFLNKI